MTDCPMTHSEQTEKKNYSFETESVRIDWIGVNWSGVFIFFFYFNCVIADEIHGLNSN